MISGGLFQYDQWKLILLSSVEVCSTMISGSLFYYDHGSLFYFD